MIFRRFNVHSIEYEARQQTENVVEVEVDKGISGYKDGEQTEYGDNAEFVPSDNCACPTHMSFQHDLLAEDY
jgi:hypothetical protein